MVMRARLGQERAAELARDDLARGAREDVGLRGHNIITGRDLARFKRRLGLALEVSGSSNS